MFLQDIAATVTTLITVIMAMAMEEKINKYAGLCDKVIEFLLAILLAFMPFAFGAVGQWSREVVVIISFAIFAVFLFRQIAGSQKFTATWAYVSLAAFILLAMFTILPMPQKTVSILSPETVKLKSELIPDLKNFTLSFYPEGTRNDIRIILSVAAVFVVVLNVFKTNEQIKWLLKIIVIVGAAVAALAIAQDIAGNGKIFWQIAAPSDNKSGPFVNHSHFGQFMNLSIGAALALILLILHGEFNKETTAAAVFEYFDSSKAKELWLLIAMISVSATAVFVSLTRGGMLSMLIAMSITVLLLSVRRTLRQHGWIVVTAALAALVCLLYTGFDSVYARLATLSDLDRYPTRLEILKDMAEPMKRFILFGTGLGSHSIIYPMFQSIYTTLRFRYAENEYAQLLEETGLAGFTLIAIFGLIIVINFIKAIRNRESSISVSAYGLGFGLIAVLIHSVSDFGQHLPANAMLSAIFCALIITLGQQAKKTPSVFRFNKPVSLIISIVFFGVYGWALIDADSARIAERWWKKAYKTDNQLRQNFQTAGDSEFEKLIGYAEKARQRQTGNIEYGYWLNIYKWWDARRKINPQTGELTDESIGKAGEIVNELKKLREVCPTYGPVYCLLGELQKFVLLEPAGEDNIRKGYKLKPNDEATLFAAGCLDISEGEIERSFGKFSKSIGLGETFFKDIVQIYIEQEKRADLAIEIAADDTQKLKYVANKLNEYNLTAESEKAKSKLLELAEQKALKKTASIWELTSLGDYHFGNGDNQKAAEYFAGAVAADYGNPDLRLKLAKALAENEEPVEAIKQLRICLKLNPKYRPAEKLLAELSINPQVIEQNVRESEK